MPRPQPVRDAVRSLIDSSQRHAWSIDELSNELLRIGVHADASSVFRALIALEAEGVVVRFDLGDGRSHFERAGEHHEHICCDRCGLVVPVPGCLLDDVYVHVRRETGFVLTNHTVVLHGICDGCQG